MHNSNSFKRITIFAIFIWLLVNVLQAVFTPIHIDEAYYWMFSQHLDWGYFDHPPAVAFLIKLSDSLFSGTLGVRFLSVVAQLASFYMIFLTVKQDITVKEGLLLKLFLVFILLPLNHIFGFITTPDVPLMFSASLFFYSLKRVVEEKDNFSFMLWSLSMAMMLYSKYHSGLVILFILLAIPSLFKNWRTYASGGFALLLFLPHILWQYEHDWVSVMYHLSERAVEFKWTFPLEYIGNILLIFNPVFILLLYKMIRKGWQNSFERGCYFVVAGFLLFFLWQSFRVQVQAQWLIVLYIPSLILMRKEIAGVTWKKIGKMFLWLAPIFIALRLFMIFDILPVKFNIHGNEAYVSQIEEDAKGREVMFYGSYKRAALYTWYGEQDYTHSYNGVINRKNQFNIWDFDKDLLEQDIYFVGVYSPGRESTYYEDGNYYGNVITYKTSDKLKVKVYNTDITGGFLNCEIQIENPYGFPIHYEEKYMLAVQYYDDKKRTDRSFPVEDFKIYAQENQNYKVRFPISEHSGTNNFSLIIRHENLPFGTAYYKYTYPTQNADQ